MDEIVVVVEVVLLTPFPCWTVCCMFPIPTTMFVVVVVCFGLLWRPVGLEFGPSNSRRSPPKGLYYPQCHAAGGPLLTSSFFSFGDHVCMYVCMYGIILCTYGTGAHINMWRSYCCATTISRPLSLLLFASSTVRTSIFPVLLLFLYRNPPRRANDVRPTRPSHPHRYVCMYA